MSYWFITTYADISGMWMTSYWYKTLSSLTYTLFSTILTQLFPVSHLLSKKNKRNTLTSWTLWQLENNMTLAITYTENLLPWTVLSPKTQVTPTNINTMPYDIYSIELNRTWLGKITNTKKDLSSNTYYVTTITTTNFITDRATSNPTTKKIFDRKDGQHSHI
jgi:hypothetical protein